MKIIKKYKYLVILLIVITLPVAWHYNRLAVKESYKNYCMNTHDPKEIINCAYDDGSDTYTAQERYDLFYNNVDKYDQFPTDIKDMFVGMFGLAYNNCIGRNQEKGKYYQVCDIKNKNKYFDLQKKCASEGFGMCTNIILGDAIDEKKINENITIFNKAMLIKNNACIDKFKKYFNILSDEQKSKLDKNVIDKCNSGKIINK